MQQFFTCNNFKHTLTYAGVSGLTTAILLLKQEKVIKVHIVANHFPGDLLGEYTSPWYTLFNLSSISI
jgi:hypothetical protein